MIFSNNQVNTDSLPRIEDIDFIPLQKEYLKVELVGTALFWLLIGIAFCAILFFNNWNIPSMLIYGLLGLLVLLCVFHFYITVAGFHKMGYALREKDIVYKSGLFWKSKTTIPFNRVQHGEIKQGPIERHFQLSQLNIYTAGGSSSDLKIPGLHPDKAETLKRFILSKTATFEEE